MIVDAWMITNGYNVGIVQLVGQAINKIRLTKPKNRITAIALCKWGSVKDVEKLIDPHYYQNKVCSNFDQLIGEMRTICRD